MKKKYINNIIFIASLIVFAFIISRYGIASLYENFTKTGYWLLPIVGVWSIVYLLNTFAFKSVLKKHTDTIPFSKVFSIVLSGYSLNYITPIIALGGELYKINILKDFVGKAQATALIVKYYIMHVLSHIAFWILGFALLAFSMSEDANTYKLLAFTAIFILVVLSFFVMILKKNAIIKMYKFCLKMPLPKSLINYMISKESYIIEIDGQIKDYFQNDKANFYKTLLYEFIARVVASLEILFILWSLGIEFNMYQAIYFSSISSLLLNILFFIPLQIGSREGVYYFLMYSIGISSPVGVYISLTGRIREFIWILCGLVLIPMTKNKIQNFEPDLEKKLITNKNQV